MLQGLENRFWRGLIRGWRWRKGRTRLQRLAWRRIGGLERVRDAFGNELDLDLDDFIDCHVYLSGGFEADAIREFARLAERHRCSVALDIGANLGLYALTLARQPFIACVHAFEPDPVVFGRLEANVVRHPDRGKIAIERVAAAESSGTAIFYVAEERHDINRGKRNRGRGSLSSPPDEARRRIQVECVALDERLGYRGERLAIKIDVEGAELRVIEGMRRLLAENACLLQVEIFEDQHERVDGALRALGYEPMAGASTEGRNFLYANRALSIRE